MKTIIASIVSILELSLAAIGSQPQPKLGSLVGTVGFVDAAGKQSLEDAPNVSVELEFRRKIIKVRSSETGSLVELLPLGTYCLKAAYDADNKPLTFSPEQHKCFKVRSKGVTRFDVMLL